MKKKIIILVCLIIYLWSAIHTYKCFNIAYSKGGRWEHTSPDSLAVVMVLFPGLNTSYALQNSYSRMYANYKPDYSLYEKMFQIKK